MTDTIIQDIKITTDNVIYHRETWYSPSLNKTFVAPLPDDIAGKGEFGVGIRLLIPLLKSQKRSNVILIPSWTGFIATTLKDMGVLHTTSS